MAASTTLSTTMGAVAAAANATLAAAAATNSTADPVNGYGYFLESDRIRWESVTVACLYGPVVIITFGLFYLRMDHPHIMQYTQTAAPFSLLLFETVCNLVVSLSVSLFGSLAGVFPAFLFYWILSLFFLAFFLCIIGRAVRLYMLYQWNLRKAKVSEIVRREMEELQGISSLRNTKSNVSNNSRNTSVGTDSTRVSRPRSGSAGTLGSDAAMIRQVESRSAAKYAGMSLEQRAQAMAQLLAVQGSADERRTIINEYSSLHQRLDLETLEGEVEGAEVDGYVIFNGILSKKVVQTLAKKLEIDGTSPDKALTSGVWVCIALSLGIQVLSIIVLSIVSYEPVRFYPIAMSSISPQIFQIHLIPTYMEVAFFFAVITPFLLYLIKGVKDESNLKRGLIVSLITAIPCYIVWFLLVFVNNSVTFTIRHYFNAGVVPLITFAVCHYYAVVRHLIISYQGKSKTQPLNRETLRKRISPLKSTKPRNELAVNTATSRYGVTSPKSSSSLQPLNRKESTSSGTNELIELTSMYSSTPVKPPIPLVTSPSKSTNFPSGPISPKSLPPPPSLQQQQQQYSISPGEVSVSSLNASSSIIDITSTAADYNEFLRILGDPSQSYMFKKFCARSLNVEVAAFRESLEFLENAVLSVEIEQRNRARSQDQQQEQRTSIQGLRGAGIKFSVVEWIKEGSAGTDPVRGALVGQCIYIIKTFLEAGALMELRCLSEGCKSEILTMFRNGYVSVDMFDEAYEEAILYLFEQLYPKFLAAKSSSN